jgi:class 3 adenylate cyclase/tetratricopeptide (TPR) repeat protein
MAHPEHTVVFLKDPALACLACGADAPMGAHFCRLCGRSLGRDVDGERAHDAQRPEHKQVTVLVADVQGSMTLSESLDPEEWYRIVTRFFVLMAEGVQRVGGVVNRFTGDGIMALFGAPVALEDHAQRACYAALRMRSALERYSDELQQTRGIGLAVRIGIHSGDVVAGPLGQQGRGGYTALGPTVHLASEMERIATPRHIFVSESTARLVDGYFVLDDRGQPGRARGVIGRVYELVRVGTFATRLERSRSRGLLPFVGRGREMGVLEHGLDDARAGRGAVIGVRGEIGVGKSRLCDEFLARCVREGVGVFRWRILSHLRGTPYLSLITEIRRMFGVAAEHQGADVRRRIHEGLNGLGADGLATAPLFERLLGVSSETQPAIDPADPARLRLMLRTLMAALGHRRPAVLLIEDAQWVDPASAKLLEVALAGVAGARLLVLLNFRPEFRMPAVAGYSEISLSPLGPRATNELLARLVGESDALADLVQEIRQRSNGNPFFMEELVTMLADTGALVGVRGAYRPGPNRARAMLPSSLQALLESRIDLLATREKEVLQAASVIGRTFSLALVRRLLDLPHEDIDEAIVVLQEGEFISASEAGDEEQYVFRHPMLHEQAYASQVSENLAAAHAAVARACTELYAQRLDERAALIAHHFEHAGRFREAALWAQRAATWIGQRNLGEGLRGWRRVFALLERAPASPEVDELAVVARCRMLELGARLGMPAQEVKQVFDDALTLVDRTGSDAQRALLHNAYSQARAFVGDVADALALAREAVRAAEEVDDPHRLLGYRSALVFALINSGAFHEGRALADALVAELPAHPWPRVSRKAAQIYLFRGMVRSVMGDPLGARDDLARAADASWQAGDVEGLSLVYSMSPTVGLMLGDAPDDCLLQAQRSVELAEYLGNPYGRVIAYAALGLAHLLLEEGRLASRVLNGALLLARDHRVGLQQESSLLADLSCATVMRGETAHALSLANEAVHVACRGVNPLREAMAQVGRAWVLLRVNGIAAVTEIEACLGRVLEVAERHGIVSYAAVAHYHLATVAEMLGDRQRRRRELERAHAAFAAMGAAGWLRRIERRMQGLSPQ